LKILLATPAHGSQVCVAYHESVVNTLMFFKSEYPGIEFESRMISVSMLSLARSAFASMVLNDESFTHLLFIDSDMGFSPSLIAKMIAFQKPVVGIIAPRRRFDYATYFKLGRTLDDPTTSRLLAADYIGEGQIVTKRKEGGATSYILKDGFVQTTFAGTGIMLIERSVFVEIRDRFPELWVPDPGTHGSMVGLKGGLLNCFEPERGENGIYPSEDVTFCRRWVEGCKGEIWANVDEFIVHVGTDQFIGKYLFKLIHEAAEFKKALEAEAQAKHDFWKAGSPNL